MYELLLVSFMRDKVAPSSECHRSLIDEGKKTKTARLVEKPDR